MSAPAGIDPATGEVLVLSDAEAVRLGELEQIIHDDEAAFFRVGGALREIRDARLYREEHGSFDAYLKTAWDMSRSYASRQITAAEVVAGLLPIGNAPRTESQARELAKVPEPERARVMDEAVRRGDGKVTASVIRKVVTETIAATPQPEPEAEPAPEPPAEPDVARSRREQDVADAADRQAQNFCQYRPEQIDERTVVRLEAWCKRWRGNQ